MDENDSLLGQGLRPRVISPVEHNNNVNMETLLNQEGMTLDFPQPGKSVPAWVASISLSQILVSVGAKSEGVITRTRTGIHSGR